MNIVSTQKAESTLTYARLESGKIDLGAYKGLEVFFGVPDTDLVVKSFVKDARVRYGHLDLLITPIDGSGEKWVERKNVVIKNDPASGAGQARGVEELVSLVSTAVDNDKKSWLSKVGLIGYNR
jgi:hypothetical protein